MGRPSKSSSSRPSEKALKDEGNSHFDRGHYEQAIDCYSKAIALNDRVAVYYTNRSLCHLYLKRWSPAAVDAREALRRDPTWIKGHFYLGRALLEQDCLDESIKHLQRAYDLAKEQRLNFGDDITTLLRVARKRRWSRIEDHRIHQEIELQAYLNRLMIEDKERKIEELRNTGQDVDILVEKIEIETDRRMGELSGLFSKVDERRQRRDVPDFLCGKISFEILKDPVITPSGITYDRRDIEEHLHRVGHFDPVTRTRLVQEQLVPNYAMKEVVDAFINDNEWALDY